MVMGLDVCHGKTEEKSKPSVVALCASINEHYTKYATALRTQFSPPDSKNREIVQDLAGMVEEVMREYLKQMQVPPHTLIFYRDGVGESMYGMVQAEEKKQLMDVMRNISQKYGQSPPRLIFLIAQKRHHLRSFAQATPKGNPWPGTFIDDPDVVDHGRPNFYLYSHKALAGTARPTHYQVLLDDPKEPPHFSVHQLAEFTYALAHLHQGCTKAVSIPAPVFYADRAAYIAATCYRAQIDQMRDELKATLFMI